MRSYSAGFFFAFAALVGCGGDNGGAGGGGAGGSGGSGGAGTTSTTSTSSTSECTSFKECSCGSVPCEATCDGCGQACSPTVPCPDAFHCAYSDHLCGAGVMGQCLVKPWGCQETQFMRSCGCSGTVAPADCLFIAGDDVAADATTCSKGTFSCGDQACKEFIEYCETVHGGVADSTSYACKPSPCPTGIAECECITGLPPGSCEKGTDGQVRVTIALP